MFDPSNHTVREVLEYSLVHPEESANILYEEVRGKNRNGIVLQLTQDLTAYIRDGFHAVRFERAIKLLANTSPGSTVRWAVHYANHDLEHPVDGDIAEWILEQPAIVALLVDKKINAIKEVRAATNLGLKEAKDAVEKAVDLQRNGYLTRSQREELAREEEEAIASILGK